MGKKFTIIFIGDACSKVLIVLANILLIRFFSVEEYAAFTLLFSVLTLGYQLVCSAIERLYISDFATFSLVANRVLFTSIAFWGISFALYLKNDLSGCQIIVFLIGIAVLSLYQLQRIKLQQRLLFGAYTSVEILKNLIWTTLVVICIYLELADTLTVISLLIVASLVCLVFIMHIFKCSETKSSLTTPRISAIKLLATQYPVFLYTMLAAIMPYLPVFLANINSDVNVLATYGVAMRFQGVIGMAVYALNTVYLPTYAKSSTVTEFNNYARKYYNKIPHMAIIFLLIIFSTASLMIFVDDGYNDAPYVFIILATCSFFSLITVPAINHLLVIKQFKRILLSILLGLVVNIIVFYLLANQQPLYSSAIGSLAGYFVITAILIKSSNIFLKKKPFIL